VGIRTKISLLDDLQQFELSALLEKWTSFQKDCNRLERSVF